MTWEQSFDEAGQDDDAELAALGAVVGGQGDVAGDLSSGEFGHGEVAGIGQGLGRVPVAFVGAVIGEVGGSQGVPQCGEEDPRRVGWGFAVGGVQERRQAS
ncbi:hypothetical protein B1H29_00005 [Streptomyces pactum]|uniref:Uncharacterized protein n=1 Tax=Streptomyces pactum TaxID=68249 RepID=A0A1S6J1D1_9ACTN|nr:hypothetical protein B1H29_00005 [Streptomyces pactum]